jgi:hypothetical protein
MKYLGYVLITIIALVAIGFATDYININKVEEPVVNRSYGGDPIDEFCLQGVYPMNSNTSFEISEDEAGEYSYQLIATPRGEVEVWIPCGKIE